MHCAQTNKQEVQIIVSIQIVYVYVFLGMELIIFGVSHDPKLLAEITQKKFSPSVHFGALYPSTFMTPPWVRND